jgi:ABC-2 type transport system permease protein
MNIRQHFLLIIALAIKELLAVLRDKKSRMVLIGPPIAQLLIFGYAATFDLNDVRVAIYNEDPGEASRELVSHISGSPNIDVLYSISHESEIPPLIDNKKVLMVLHVHPQFSADIASGKSGQVQLILDGRNSNTAMIALNYINEIILQFNKQWARDNHAQGPPAILESRAWYNENLRSRWFIVSGIIGLLTLVVSLIVTALSVAREREQGTFDQLLVTPVHPVFILIGKALPGLLIGVVEGSFIILVAVLWFSLPLRGSIGTLYLGLILFLLSSVGIGLMISSICVTQQQAVLGAFLFLVPGVILSGFATPIANMPYAVQLLTYLNPLRYFLIIVRSVFMEAGSYDLLWPQFWPMAIIAAITLMMAAWLFRHRMY